MVDLSHESDFICVLLLLAAALEAGGDALKRFKPLISKARIDVGQELFFLLGADVEQIAPGFQLLQPREILLKV